VPRKLVAIVAILLLALTTSALAEGEVYEPTFERQEAWLHAHTLPIGNLDGAEGRFVTWDDAEPTSPVPAVYHGNNPAGILDGRLPEHFFTAAGTFTGDLENLAFDMYLHGWAQSTIGCGISLSFELKVDGKTLLSQEYTGSEGFVTEQVAPGVVKTRFALTNMWEASKRRNVPFGEELEHEVYVNIQNFYICNEFTWLYDAASTPSGLIANVESPASEGYFEVDVLRPPPPIG
jgi:hypothetical protein